MADKKENLNQYIGNANKSAISAALAYLGTCTLYPLELIKFRMQSKTI